MQLTPRDNLYKKWQELFDYLSGDMTVLLKILLQQPSIDPSTYLI